MKDWYIYRISENIVVFCQHKYTHIFFNISTRQYDKVSDVVESNGGPIFSGQFKLYGNQFSASYEASEFCWQIGLNFLQHLRPCHILSLKLEQTKGNPQKDKGNDINKDGDGDKDSP